MPILSDFARRKKIRYFLAGIPKDASILEIGCGGGWVRDVLAASGHERYIGLDLTPPADIVGDILDWRKLGLEQNTFDYIIAFEVVEHVDCFRECYDLLKPGGRLLLTSPLPQMDWFMKLLEAVHLNQRRTSPHDHLVDFRLVPFFSKKEVKIVAGLSQWGIFTR